ncbi:MAG: hypothetical protein KKF44_02670 [Nanoarchaeota archaeon]|nr:hypothetical protein [Nanoarchaeota archaeon]
MVKLIIEHLDTRLWKWSYIEYKHISDFAGKENVIFTNIKGPKTTEKLSRLGEVHQESIKNLKFNNACVLDPSAEKTLSPKDNYDYLILGGILGDHPPQERTKEMLTKRLELPSRNLGTRQFSTNTAAYVALKICRGTPIEKIEFEDELVVKVSDSEEIILPFPYVKEKGKLVIPEGYLALVTGH